MMASTEPPERAMFAPATPRLGRAEGTRRVPCPGCLRARYFRQSEVFADNRLEVELRKPCPHCGDAQTLRMSRFAELETLPINEVPGVNVPWVLAHLDAPVEGDD